MMNTKHDSFVGVASAVKGRARRAARGVIADVLAVLALLAVIVLLWGFGS